MTVVRSSVAGLQHLSQSDYMVNGDVRYGSGLIDMPVSVSSVPVVAPTHITGTHLAVSVSSVAVPTSSSAVLLFARSNSVPPVSCSLDVATNGTTCTTQLSITPKNFILQSTINCQERENNKFVDLACLLLNNNIQMNSMKQIICILSSSS